MTAREFVFLMSAPDQSGILAGVAATIAAQGGDIRDAASYGDNGAGQFFLRIHLSLPHDGHADAMAAALMASADRFRGKGQLYDLGNKPKVMIAVSKFDHCLVDLLARFRKGQLDAELAVVFSNHEDARSLVEWHDVPFVHLPITPETKAQQEADVKALIASYEVDLVVLARYMQILSPDMAATLSGRCINIHHSFLPSFKGAKPYHQAHQRGVKLIGATAHYVTDDLDEGPIIEQDVRRVTHATSADEMVAIGREVEASVLGRAVRWHLERRVLFNGRKTVVFS
ncbi:MAG: formyltetrahydrofolate deformylase [Pseudomonadota bacterium]